MPSEQQLIEALRRADAAGDTGAAQRFAELIKQGRAGGGAEPVSAAATFIQRAGQTFPFVPQLASAAAAAVDPARTEPTFGGRYAAAREALAQRSAAGSEQHPAAGRLGTAAGVAGQVAAAGGTALLNPLNALRALRTGAAAVPTAIRALGTPEGISAAARALPAGALAGLGYSDADIALARGDVAGAAQQATIDAATGAALSGAAGALGHGAKLRADKALAAETARRAPVQSNIATEAAAVATTAANTQAKAAHRTAVDAAKAANKATSAQYTADVAAAKAAAKQQTATLKQAAEQRANAPLASRSLETLGLDSARGRGMLGGPLRAAEEAPRIANTPVPELGGATYGELSTALERDPVKLGKVVQEVRRGIGARIGAVRSALAETTARVSPHTILERVNAELGQSEFPREARIEAAAAVTDILEKARGGTGPVGVTLLDAAGKPIRSIRAGELKAGQLRKFIEDVEDQLGFQAGAGGSTLQKVLGDRADGILLAARDAAVELEKGMVSQHLPSQLAQYTDDVARYRTAKIVEQGTATKIARPEGKAIRRPTPERVEPVAPRAVPRPAQTPIPGLLALQPIPKVSAEAKAAERLVRRAEVPGVKGFVRNAAPGLGAAVGGALGAQVAGFPGGAAGASAGAASARAIANRFIRAVRPSRAQFLANSDKVLAAISRYEPIIAAADRAGPRVANAIHRALIAKDPDYADAFESESRRAAPQSFEEFSAAWRSRAAGR